MMQLIFIVIWFLIVLGIQTSFIFTLPTPLHAIPLALMAGVLIVHRTERVYSILWFAGCAILLPIFDTSPGTFFAYLSAGLAAWILEQRIFTSRSLYALIGLGTSVYTVFTAVRVLFAIIFSRDVGGLLSDSFFGILLMIVGLYCIFALNRSFEKSRARFVIVRHT